MEYAISETKDNRIQGTWTATDTSNPGWSDTSYSRGRTVGTVKSVNCWRGGKFVPGSLKLRDASFWRWTASFGDANLGFRRIHGSGKGTRYTVQGMCGSSRDFETVSRDLWDPLLANLSETKCFAKLQGCEEAVAESLAELPENLRMIHNGISSIRKAIKNARKRGFSWSRAARALRELKSNGKRVKRLPVHLANAWLTWRYGIRPLIWEYLMYVRIINERISSSNFSGLQRKTASVDGSVTTRNITYADINISGCLYDAVERRTVKVKSKTSVYFRIANPFGPYDGILHYYGLHPEQLPGLLWEITPLSFMVDWFSNMGDWIRAITPSIRSEILGYSTSQKVEISGTRTGGEVHGSGINPNIEYFGSGPTDMVSVESLVRKVGSSRPLMYPWVTPGVVLDIQRWLDILTVALQRAKPRRT